jgi:hypothetical protein
LHPFFKFVFIRKRGHQTNEGSSCYLHALKERGSFFKCATIGSASRGGRAARHHGSWRDFAIVGDQPDRASPGGPRLRGK